MTLALHLLLGLAGVVLALIAALVLLTLLDVFVFPRWWPSRWFAPVCGVFGHTDDDMDEDEDGFGVCARCGVVFFGPEDAR